MEENKREWVNHNACRFCKGSRGHTCYGYDCREAVRAAGEYFESLKNDSNRDSYLKKSNYAMAVHSTATGQRQMIRITSKNVTWIRTEAYAIQRSHALKEIGIHIRKSKLKPRLQKITDLMNIDN